MAAVAGLVVDKTAKVVRLNSLPEAAGPEFLANEVRKFGSQQLLDENRTQSRLKPPNKPVRLVVDNKSVIPLSEAQQASLTAQRNITFLNFQRSLTFFYTTTADLFKAVADAYASLVNLMPKKSGTGVSTIHFWVSFGGKGNGVATTSIANVRTILNRRGENLDTVSVHILGPVTEYRRVSLYYQNVRYRKVTKSNESRLVEDSSGMVKYIEGRKKKVSQRKYQVSVAAHEIVRNQMRRKYKDLFFMYRSTIGHKKNFGNGTQVGESHLPLFNSPAWRPTGPTKNRFIPVLIIGVKREGKRGRTRGALSG